MTKDAARRTGRPTLEEAAALKERIMDQTLATVRAKGSRGFSIDHVASLAGVTKRTIYRHFANKAELIDAVVGREIERLRGHVVAVDAIGSDPLDTLKTWSGMFFEQSLRPELIDFSNFISFEAGQDAELGKRQQHWYSVIINHIAGLIEAAQHVGAIRSADSRIMALLLIDLISGSSRRKRSGIPDALAFADPSPEQHFATRWQAFSTLAETPKPL